MTLATAADIGANKAVSVDRRLVPARWARGHLVPHLDIGTGVTATADGGRLLAADVRLLLPGGGCVLCVSAGWVTATKRSTTTTLRRARCRGGRPRRGTPAAGSARW